MSFVHIISIFLCWRLGFEPTLLLKAEIWEPFKMKLVWGFQSWTLTQGHQNRRFDHVWEWMWTWDGNLHVLKWVSSDGCVQDGSPHMSFVLKGYQISTFQSGGLVQIRDVNPRIYNWNTKSHIKLVHELYGTCFQYNVKI